MNTKNIKPHSFRISAFLFAFLLTGCANRKPATKGTEAFSALSGQLEARLGIAANTLSKDSVLLSFTVVNYADAARRFCKWETPFEPFLGKYFEVKDAQGNEALFTGAMARRVMPPPPESYISVSPHDSVKTEFNLARNYSLTNGEYSITYTGEGVSGLKGANEIKVRINATPLSGQ